MDYYRDPSMRRRDRVRGFIRYEVVVHEGLYKCGAGRLGFLYERHRNTVLSHVVLKPVIFVNSRCR